MNQLSIFPVRVLLAAVLALSVTSAGVARAQSAARAERPFPLVVVDRTAPLGTWTYRPRPGALAELAELPSAAGLDLVGVPLPDGRVVDLSLERLSFDFSRVGVLVDGVPAPWSPGDLTMWRGSVVGEDSSEVLLGLASLGVFGWIDAGGERWHVGAFVEPGGSSQRPSARLLRERVAALLRDPREAEFCATPDAGAPIPRPVGPPVAAQGASGTTLECRVAIETDFELVQRLGGLAPAQNYVMQLLAAVSARFENDIDVVLLYPYVQFYTQNNDPWTANVQGVNTQQDLLAEFRAHYQGNFPASAHLMHLLSGVPLGGGVAALDVLCDQARGFAVSSAIGGGVSFPLVQQTGNWDYFVVCHELGHNFGSRHTHAFCPPLDSCAQSFGPCQTMQQCITSGTLMSYCHLCPGGTANISNEFHPFVRSILRTAAEASCLPPLTPPGHCLPDPLEPNDTCADASAIGAGLALGLTATDVSPDFYLVEVPAGATLDVDLFFSHASGDLDLYLFLHEPVIGCSTATVAASTTATDGEAVRWTNSSIFPQRVAVEARLAATSAAPCNAYALQVAYDAGSPVGSTYCGPSVINSSLRSARIAGAGSTSVSANALGLAADRLPPFATGYFLVSQAPGLVPNPGGSVGDLCLAAPFGRFVSQAQGSGLTGAMAIPLDLVALAQPTGPVAAQAGETWHFQLWFRDAVGGLPTSNFTDALAVTLTQ